MSMTDLSKRKVEVQTYFQQKKYSHVVELSKSFTDPQIKYFLIRSLIEIEQLEDAQFELEKSIPISGFSLPLSCLMLNQFKKLKLTENGKKFWLKHNELILKNASNNDQNALWIVIAIADSLWAYESKFDPRFHSDTWITSKARTLLRLVDDKQLSEFIREIELNFGHDYSALWHIKGQVAAKKYMFYEARNYYIKHFRQSSKRLEEKVFLLDFLVKFYGENALSIDQDIVNHLMEVVIPPCDDSESKIYSRLVELQELFVDSKNSHKCYKVAQIESSEVSKGGVPGIQHSVLSGFQILSSETINEPLPSNFKSLCIYAIEPSGKAVYLSRPNSKKILLREAPFSKVAAYQHNSGSLKRVELSALRDINVRPCRHRYIASPGRVGSTLIHKILREAGIESISETWTDTKAPQLAWEGVISQQDSIFLSKLDSDLLFDENESPSFVVKKLSGDSSRYIEALMSEDDDVVFLYREIESWIQSYRRMGVTPERVAGLLQNTLHAHIAMQERNKLVHVLSYSDLVDVNENSLEKAFGDIPHSKWKKYELDSQGETHLSRSNLIKNIPQYSTKEYMEAINKSSSIDIARDLGLDLISSGFSRSIPKVHFNNQTNRESVLVVPGAKWGSITHYYHFMFGLFLPFISKEMHRQHETHYYLPEIGPMSRHLSKLVENGWSFGTPEEASALNTGMRRVTPIGWDHPSAYHMANLEQVRDYIFKIFSIKQEIRSAEKNILIIGRGQESNKSAPSDTYGAQRRTIPNLDDLYLKINGQANVTFVELDLMELDTQITLFANSDCIIAQHGAALSNLIFCRPNTTIIEVIDSLKRPMFFQSLSERLKLNHILFDQEHPKAPINIPDIIKVLREYKCI
jgi:hypothetical protein